jgi:hypothetical protein
MRDAQDDKLKLGKGRSYVSVRPGTWVDFAARCG